MRKFYIAILLLHVIFSSKTTAQVIPDSLKVDWTYAGFEGDIPGTSFIINVKDFGATGDGTHDDYAAINKAIHSSTAFRVVYFPAGDYLIQSPLNIPANVIIRGDGVASNLQFNLSQYKTTTDCITISKKQESGFTKIKNGYYKGSSSLTLVKDSIFTIGDYAEIKENNGDWDPDKSKNYVGQIVKITGINGNTISFTPALRIDYIDSLEPKIRPVQLIEKTGLECFKITRLDPPTAKASGSNIMLKYANNCWITGVESAFCQTSHISLISCTHITISGCYVHDAFTFNGGGHGYGIFLHTHTCDSRVENSIFHTLRHAMILASGANGNVVAYNYSFDPRSTTEVPQDNIGDLSLHGHYAYANLLEGNIVQNLIVDDFWGAAGPYNTFFRNREELYGIEILDQYHYTVKSEKQNIVGNEVTNTGYLKGKYEIQTQNNFTYNNNIKNNIQPESTDTLNDKSYYLTGKPYFWNINSGWPSIGGNNIINTGSIPAKERYFSSSAKTICLNPPSTTLHVTISADSIFCNGGLSDIKISATDGAQPYAGVGEILKPAGNYSFIVTDAFGYSDTEYVKLSEPAPIQLSCKTTKTSSCKDDGSIIVKRTGGTPPFQYSLNNIFYVNTNTFYNLPAGNYTVWIKDKNGCIDSLTDILIKSFPPLKISFQKTNASCKNKNDGSIIMNAQGGKPPYLFSLDSIHFTSNNIFTNLFAGIYTAWVQDADSCITTSRVIIKYDQRNCTPAIDDIKKQQENKFNISVFPNPATTQFTLLKNGAGNVDFSVTDMYGRIIYRVKNESKSRFDFGNNFVPGIYILSISDGATQKIIKLIKR